MSAFLKTVALFRPLLIYGYLLVVRELAFRWHQESGSPIGFFLLREGSTALLIAGMLLILALVFLYTFDIIKVRLWFWLLAPISFAGYVVLLLLKLERFCDVKVFLSRPLSSAASISMVDGLPSGRMHDGEAAAGTGPGVPSLDVEGFFAVADVGTAGPARRR